MFVFLSRSKAESSVFPAGIRNDNRYGAHRQFLQKPAGRAKVCVPHRNPAGIPGSGLGLRVVPKALPFPIKHRILPMVEFCPMFTSGFRVPEG